MRKINYCVAWTLVSTDHVSPQSRITRGAQITIRRMHSGHGTEIYFMASCVASHCIVRLRWAQWYPVSGAKPYINSGLEPNSLISKLQTWLRSIRRPVRATLEAEYPFIQTGQADLSNLVSHSGLQVPFSKFLFKQIRFQTNMLVPLTKL